MDSATNPLDKLKLHLARKSGIILQHPQKALPPDAHKGFANTAGSPLHHQRKSLDRYIGRIWQALLFALAALLLVSCGSDPTSSRPAPLKSPPTPAVAPTSIASIVSLLATATSLAKFTARPSPTPTLTGPQLDATKNAFLANMERTQVAAKTRVAQNRASQVPTRVRSPLPTAKPQPTPVEGLFSCDAGVLGFSNSSCWLGYLGGGFVYVYSGQWRNIDSIYHTDHDQGAIQVEDTRPGGGRATYNSPQKAGGLMIEYVNLPRLTLIAPSANHQASMFVFNLDTKQWENTAGIECHLFPLAFRADTFENMQAETRNSIKAAVPLYSATSPPALGSGAFAWLTIQPDSGKGNSSTGILEPGESVGLINPDDPADDSLNVGDWVQGQDANLTDQAKLDALNYLFKSGYIVPVPLWDEVSTQGSGQTLKYHISGFAWFRPRVAATSSPVTELTTRYWGQADCPAR